VEKHGVNALLEFPQDETVHPIERLTRGLIPDAPHPSIVVDALAAASAETATPTEVDQERVGQVHSDRAADYYRKGLSNLPGRPDEAVLSFMESWGAALETKDRLFMARSSQELADIANMMGERAKAFSWYMESLRCYRNLAVEKRSDDYDAARRLFEEEVEVAKKAATMVTVFENPLQTLKMHRVVADELWSLAEATSLQGNEERARRLLEESADVFVRTVKAAGQGGMEHEILDVFPRLLVLFEKLEDKKGQAYALHGLGIKTLFEGKLDEARELFECGLTISEEQVDRQGVASNLLYMGIADFYQDRLEDAHALFTRSREASEKARVANVFADSWLWMANIAFEKGDPDEGALCLRRSAEIYAQFESTPIVNKLDEFAQLARDLGKDETARRLVERGREMGEFLRPSYFHLS
jgi:tetratricopeptide (TPR) repeat protein